MTGNAKTTALIPSVGADGGQPPHDSTKQRIPHETCESNPPEENIEEMREKIRRMNDPRYLHTVSMTELYQTVYFLPYVTNTLAVGLVFMILFRKTPYSDGLMNALLSGFGLGPVDFIDGPYAAKLFVLCFYTIWVVLPFKILILTSALASVKADYYKAARVDGTSKWRTFARITLPMISPTIFYLVVTGFIGAFKSYSDAVALFGVDLNAAGMNTLVGYIYDMLYGNSGGYPSYASAAAILLFAIVLTIAAINLLVSKKHVHY